MTNLQIWNALKTPPKSALKEIKGGRLSGMTDINPQWRYQAMTEHFGPCGTGWGWTITRLWNETTGQETLCFAQVEVWYNSNEKHVGRIPGVGGSKMVAAERGGVHNSDECYKMAITDALSVALKMLGVGADVYLGQLDSKYAAVPEKPTTLDLSELRAIAGSLYKQITDPSDNLTNWMADLAMQNEKSLQSGITKMQAILRKQAGV